MSNTFNVCYLSLALKRRGGQRERRKYTNTYTYETNIQKNSGTVMLIVFQVSYEGFQVSLLCI